ncbi:MAG: hypothetical protein JW791_03385 [Nanoarchaeota archaeon]|nr:hypothetical protein [Nanoarchaeota archaeon]
MSLEQVSKTSLSSEEISLIKELGAEKAFEIYIENRVKKEIEYYMRMNIDAIREQRFWDMEKYNKILIDQSKMRATIKVRELERLFLYKKLEKNLKAQ